MSSRIKLKLDKAQKQASSLLSLEVRVVTYPTLLNGIFIMWV